MGNNIFEQKHGIILWFTGLSGSGKTTVAERVSTRIQEKDISVQIIDGDKVRRGRHQHLGFSEKDIKTNNSLIANLCNEERKNRDLVIVPIISPYRQSRKDARMKLHPGFYEIYFSASLDYVSQIDVKGLYAKSAAGSINNMIGVSTKNPYQPPESPDFIINTEKENIQQSVENLFRFSIKHLSVNHANQAIKESKNYYGIR